MSAARSLRCAAWAAAPAHRHDPAHPRHPHRHRRWEAPARPAPPPDRGIRVDEARAALTDPTVEPCGFCRPETELSIDFA
ncbi:DUF6233 domain-containing protein [Streptomyces sp. NPDC093064]|uniref:DUF6233 domain-containing protein n=1 Tax=Streptomyces sp. NPDC093064 TaxID=3366020 RepID=UPI0037F3924B